MKNAFRFLTVTLLPLAVFALFFVSSCEGPRGPMGANGTDGSNGTNGTDGLNGQDANTACLKCHTTLNWTAKTDQYHLSKHFLGTTVARGQTNKFCARCHTNEGFQEITENEKFECAAEIPSAKRITCETCHKHNAFDFAGDTLTYVLRTTTPVFLNYNNNTTSTDFGKTNNLCVTCHQIRGRTAFQYQDSLTGAVKTMNPVQLPYFPMDLTKNPATDTVKYMVGRSISVHDGNQSNLFKGINGYEYPGVTYARTWQHSSEKCTFCHMNTYNDTTHTGGHTMIPNEAAPGCNTCHNLAAKITTTQALIAGKLVELRDLLVAKKIYRKLGTSYSALPTHDFYGNVFPTTSSATKYGTVLSSNNSVGTTTGIIVYGNVVKMDVDTSYAYRLGRAWKYGELGAAYNYGFINSELSIGVHNESYALQLLQSSIDWLNAH